MRVLVTGHLGYIGAVLAPVVRDAGHEVVGLDSGLYAGMQVQPLAEIPELRKDLRDVEASDLAGFDAVMHLAALSNDPLGDLDPNLTYAINREASVRLAEVAKQAGVRRFLFASSCSVYGVEGDSMADEESTALAADALCREQGPGRARPQAAGRRRFLPGLSALRHRLRRLADAALRRGDPEPGRPRGDDRAGRAQERRHLLAAAGPSARHHPGLSGHARCPGRRHPRPAVQRRQHGREPAHPRARDACGGSGAGLDAGVRRGCFAGQALLPGELRQDRARPCPPSGRPGRPGPAPGSITRRSAAAITVPSRSRGRASCGSSGSATGWPRAACATICARPRSSAFRHLEVDHQQPVHAAVGGATRRAPSCLCSGSSW